MKLVVDQPDFKLYEGDAFIVMRDLIRQRRLFDMIFLDPPFFDWESGSKGDKKPQHSELSYLTYRLLRPEGSVWLCGTQPQLANDYRYWRRFFTLNFEIIQYKNVGAPAINRKQWLRVHENIWCLYRSSTKWSDLKMTVDRLTRKGETKGIRGKPMRLWGAGKKEWRVNVGYPRSVYPCQKITKGHREYVGHPTQKPEGLIRKIVEFSTEPGDWILDPFCGSGTLPAVALPIDRKVVAVEIEPKYVEIIKARTKNALKQGRMDKWI